MDPALRRGRLHTMRPTTASQSTLESLKGLTRLVQRAEGFHPLVAALQNGHGATVDGAWGSSSALVAAALGLHAPQTLLVVIAFPRDLDGWTEDLASFAAVRPVVFPAWDNLPTEETLLDEVAGQRLRVLRQLQANEPPRYVLTTIQALTQPVPDRARLAQHVAKDCRDESHRLRPPSSRRRPPSSRHRRGRRPG